MQKVLSKRNAIAQTIVKDFKRNRAVYLMLIPVLAYFILFCYLPMGGLVMAFQNFKIRLGFLGSKWVGFEHFVDFLTGPYAWRTIRNTLVINFYQLIFGFPIPIIFAILVNEIKCRPYQRTVQTISYMPHFISMVVLCGMISDFSASMGLFNTIGQAFGAPRISFLSEDKYYRFIYVGSGIWKQMGWSSILYLSTLSGVDPALHEAAAIDGAGRFRRVIHVTMPALIPIIAVQLIMRIGHIMGEGHQKTILLYNDSVMEVADIVSSYVYRRGFKQNDYSFGAAVDLFNSIVNIIVLCSANYFSKHVVKESLW